MKGPGFDKLRIAAMSGASALASLFGAVTRSARASTQLPLAYSSATRWQAQSSDCADRFGLSGHQCGLGLRQFSEIGNTQLPATWTAPVTTFAPPTDPASPTTSYTPVNTSYGPPTTPMGGTTYTPPPTTMSPSDDDRVTVRKSRAKRLRSKDLTDIFAFNNSLGLSVGNDIFRAPGGRVDLSGDTVSAGPQNVGGLNASIQYKFFGPRRLVRAVFMFDNTTGAALDVDVHTNIGGFDGGSTIAASSRGESHATGVNRWFETTDAHASNGTMTGPSVLFVASGVDGRWALPTISKISLSNGVDVYVNHYDFRLAAGAHAAVMVFAQANADPLSANDVDATFSNLTTLDAAGLLVDLPVARKQLVNWNAALRPLPLSRHPVSVAKVLNR